MDLKQYISHFSIKSISELDNKLSTESASIKGRIFEQFTIHFYMFNKRYIKRLNTATLDEISHAYDLKKQLSDTEMLSLYRYVKTDIGIDFISIYEVNGSFYFDLIQSKYRNAVISLGDISTFNCIFTNIKSILCKIKFKVPIKIISTLFCNNELTENARIIPIDNIINICEYKNDDYNKLLFGTSQPGQPNEIIYSLTKKVSHYENLIKDMNNQLIEIKMLMNSAPSDTETTLRYVLDKFTNEALRKVAKDYEIKNISKLNKSSLIDILIPLFIQKR